MSEQKKPGIRVDGGKRVDLAKMRAKKAAVQDTNRPLRPTPTPAQAKSAAKAVAKRAAAEARRVRRFKDMDGGKDGAKTSTVSVKISDTRRDSYKMRSRPGTFDWTYGRDKQSALFHGGNHFARLWERAGVAVASSADFLRGTSSGYMSGMADGRITAIDKLKGTVEALGRQPFERLMRYCVEGLTAREIASREGLDEREVAIVLKHDLRACALHFGFLTPNAGRAAA